MFISDTMDQYSLELILRNEVDFVVVDTRLVDQTQKSGCFYEGCTGYGDEAATVTPAMFDEVRGPHRGSTWSSTGRSRSTTSARCAASPPPFEDRPDPGLPGTWTPWQVGLTALLLLVGVLLRRRLLHFRRFRAGDAWRFALVIPVAMVIGAIGVLLGFAHVPGAVPLPLSSPC